MKPRYREERLLSADPLLSPEQLADYLGVPIKTVYRWREHRDGPPGFRVGRHVRYRASDVDAWIGERLAAERADAGPGLDAVADPARTGGRRERRTSEGARPRPARTPRRAPATAS